MRMEAAKAAALLVVAIVEIRLAECRVACHFVGYEDALYEPEKCLCIDRKDYQEIVNRRPILIPKRNRKAKAAPDPVPTVSALDYMPEYLTPPD